jgi:hypothetical protein
MVASCYSETSSAGNAEEEGIILLKGEVILSKEECVILSRNKLIEEETFFCNAIRVLALQ